MSIIDSLTNREEVVWLNPDRIHMEQQMDIEGFGFVYMKAALNRFLRFMPYFASAFPETAARRGNIESELIPIPQMQAWLNAQGAGIRGNLYLKDDAHLPIAGSVKARGGIHEVIKIAEQLAMKANMLSPTDNYAGIDSAEFKEFYSQYTIQVGSTGNLGLSIGRTGARLGFRVIVHMSSDAKEWKKELLRREGVIVKEYDGDYSLAVAQGRAESEQDPNSFFVDDENSQDLFFGYSSVAMRLKVQLMKANIPVGTRHPLFVYIPCGVGGAPGGITFGLRQMFGDAVHCFFAEPVDAPCFTLGMASGKYNDICVQDIGLSGNTIADGLAVGRASGFACKMMKPLMSGAFTVADDKLPVYQEKLEALENIFLEPSACAGFHGVDQIGLSGSEFEAYIREHNLTDYMDQATHIVWGTGGGLMPR